MYGPQRVPEPFVKVFPRFRGSPGIAVAESEARPTCVTRTAIVSDGEFDGGFDGMLPDPVAETDLVGQLEILDASPA